MTERGHHFFKKDPMIMTPPEREMFEIRKREREAKRFDAKVEAQLDKLEKYKKGFDALIKKFNPDQQSSLRYIGTDDDGVVGWELCLIDVERPLINGAPNHLARFSGTINEIDEDLNKYLESGEWI